MQVDTLTLHATLTDFGLSKVITSLTIVGTRTMQAGGHLDIKLQNSFGVKILVSTVTYTLLAMSLLLLNKRLHSGLSLTLSRVPAKIVGGAAWADISGVAHVDVFTHVWKHFAL